jgi:Lar family restriction alleviation protein
MTAELLACPFCGGEAARHWGEHSFNDAIIRCTECYAEGAIFDVDDCGEDESGRNEADAIAAWNRRAIPAAPSDVAGKPITPLMPDHERALWMQIDLLFQKHGLAHPPYQLRDKLVTHLSWAHYGHEAAALIESLTHDREVMRDCLLGIALSDRYRRYPKQHEDGGIRGQSGLRAVRALTGKHGSYLSDDEVVQLDKEARAALASLKEAGK